MWKDILDAIDVILKIKSNELDPHVKKAKLCNLLKELHKDLKTIIVNGEHIGYLIDKNSRYKEDSAENNEIFKLLKKQSSNVERAKRSFEKIQEAIQIKFPEMSDTLHFYLPRKGNVLNVLISDADEMKIKSYKDLFGRPSYNKTENIDSLKDFLQQNQIDLLDYSHDCFDQLIYNTEKLRKLIDKICSFEDLV